MGEEKGDKTLWEELVKFTGSEKEALKLSKILDRRKDRELTSNQQIVFEYIQAGKPLGTLRQLALTFGFDHPQKLVAILAGLVMKGYLVPTKERK